jgi:hypothetical protein
LLEQPVHGHTSRRIRMGLTDAIYRC